MQPRRVAVIAAMERELGPLLRGVKGFRQDEVVLYELESATVVVAGIGKNAAHKGTLLAIRHVKPELLISAGVCGALRSEMKAGDLITVREVIDAESGARFVTREGDGVLVTSNFISGEDDKRRLRSEFGADAVDMEAAVVAAVAREQGIEFAAIKAVSDEFGFAMPPLGQFVDRAGQFATARFTVWLAAHPSWWGAVKVLKKNTEVASVNLSCVLPHLIQQHTQATREENVSLG